MHCSISNAKLQNFFDIFSFFIEAKSLENINKFHYLCHLFEVVEIVLYFFEIQKIIYKIN